MTPRWLMLAVAVVLAGIVALVFIQPRMMISPGVLRPAHAGLEGRCSTCHAPFRGAVAGRCVSCHAVADIGRRTTRGEVIVSPAGRPPFHQSLTSQNCLSCHTEHHGASSARPVASFSHSLLSPITRAQCSTCHTPPADAIHRGQSGNCSTCHSMAGWQPSTFDHSRYFPLEGPHDVPCATCHVGGDHSRYTCFSCHEHQPDRTRAEHEREGVSYHVACVACHRGGRGEEGEDRSGEHREGDD
jgi:hypothetical protein